MQFIKEENRIYATNIDNETVAEVTFYEIENGIYNIDHTFVDDSLRGQGVGSKLVQEAVNTIREKGAQIQATCPFASKWLEENVGSV